MAQTQTINMGKAQERLRELIEDRAPADCQIQVDKSKYSYALCFLQERRIAHVSDEHGVQAVAFNALLCQDSSTV